MAVRTFRVEGMRDDTRSPEERRSLEAAEAQPLDMSVDHVLDLARERTRLRDFGPMDFVERLGLLLGEVEADENVWKASKATFVEQCAEAAANRLLIQHYWSEHPSSLDIVIDRPVNVIALRVQAARTSRTCSPPIAASATCPCTSAPSPRPHPTSARVPTTSIRGGSGRTNVGR